MDGTLPNFESTRWGAHYTEIDLASTFRGGQGKNYKFACNQDQQVAMAGTYLQPHYGNGVFGNVYLSAGQH
jgi:hypothetical protein